MIEVEIETEEEKEDERKTDIKGHERSYILSACLKSFIFSTLFDLTLVVITVSTSRLSCP